MNSKIDALILTKKVIFTCGTGGVGKTTLSAALAVRAAILGKRAIVLTIDPAKRLATSLGITISSDEAYDLTPLLKKLRPDLGVGTLEAVMPDTKKTLERFFQAVSPKPELAKRITESRIFRTLGRDFSGANEYMALQRLGRLLTENKHDLIIVDTPPSRNTLHFFQAPELLARLFQEPLIRTVVLPANRLFAGGMKKVLGIFENLTGGSFLSELIEFLGLLLETEKGFVSQIHSVSNQFRSSDTGFIMVAGPNPESAAETDHFIEYLRKKEYPFLGLFLNRTLISYPSSPPATSIKDEAMTLLLSRIVEEKKLEARLKKALSKQNLFFIFPELARDVHSLEDLDHVAHFFSTDQHSAF